MIGWNKGSRFGWSMKKNCWPAKKFYITSSKFPSFLASEFEILWDAKAKQKAKSPSSPAFFSHLSHLWGSIEPRLLIDGDRWSAVGNVVHLHLRGRQHHGLLHQGPIALGFLLLLLPGGPNATQSSVQQLLSGVVSSSSLFLGDEKRKGKEGPNR